MLLGLGFGLTLNKRITIFEQLGLQERLWRLGKFDYLEIEAMSPRFEHCRRLINESISAPISMLDVGAGTGRALEHMFDIISSYCYVDVSRDATARFMTKLKNRSFPEIKIETRNCDITSVQHQEHFDVILGLGLNRFVYPHDIFERLSVGCLNRPGLIILEASVQSEALDYYQLSAFQRSSRFSFRLSDDFANSVREREICAIHF